MDLFCELMAPLGNLVEPIHSGIWVSWRGIISRKAIRRDFDIIGEELPVIAKQGYDGGYLLADGVGKHQNTLTQEQLECLEKVAVTCGSEDRKIVLSIIREFGPYCESFT